MLIPKWLPFQFSVQYSQLMMLNSVLNFMVQVLYSEETPGLYGISVHADSIGENDDLSSFGADQCYIAVNIAMNENIIDTHKNKMASTVSETQNARQNSVAKKESMAEE